MNLAGHQIEASQQGHCAVALVFVVAGKGRVHAGLGRQIGCRRCDRLDTRLLVVVTATASFGFFFVASFLRIFTVR